MRVEAVVIFNMVDCRPARNRLRDIIVVVEVEFKVDPEIGGLSVFISKARLGKQDTHDFIATLLCSTLTLC